MLRSPTSTRAKIIGLVLCAVVGALAAVLVKLGNPGNMGICGACFLRDWAGATGLSAKAPAYLRPEVAGLLLGPFVMALAHGTFTARSGSHAVARFILGILMGIAALVFLGCPFRMLQRLGGGDLNAWFALPGFLAGALAGVFFEKRGYSIGKTSPAPKMIGLLGVLAVAVLFALFLNGALQGPGPNDAAGKPPHALWGYSLGIGTFVGAILSLTGFCAISAARQIVLPGKLMLAAAGVLVLGYAAAVLIFGKFNLASSGQPVAHGDLLWNILALFLLGLSGALAGGCPVRQMVMAGEGNGDAFVCVSGLILGGALAHNFGLVSTAATAEAAGGATSGGQIAVGAGIVFCLVFAATMMGTGQTAE